LSGLKRNAKAAALSIVESRASSAPDPVSAAALRMMKIGLEAGLKGNYEGGARGAACVSIDFDVTSSERYQSNHVGTKALLRLSEAYGIPLTWAICGKTAEEDRSAYESILSCSVKQEIGVHTYSHIYADETTEEEFGSDIERCIQVLGISMRPTTFVFPKNREGHFGLLNRLGFRAYRGGHRVIGAPVENQGLWNVRPVYYVDQKSLKAAGLICKFIDACIARGAVFHLWTHPWSLAIDEEADRMASEALEPVFEHMDQSRKSGALTIATMGDLSNFMGSRS
jgi:peptidoglycan/xylan/chitin deacetylase (PgdA/CDA1 family)